MTSRFQYRDPLIGVLDYLAEVSPYLFSVTSVLISTFQKKCGGDCPAETVAIAHDDDLQLIEEVVRLSPNQNTLLYPQGQLIKPAHRIP